MDHERGQGYYDLSSVQQIETIAQVPLALWEIHMRSPTAALESEATPTRMVALASMHDAQLNTNLQTIVCQKTWSATQEVVAMSSAEAELCAMTKDATRGMRMKTMLSETGEERKRRTCASAAKSVSSQRDLRQMPHIEVKKLWLQGAVEEAKVKLHTIAGESNPADLLTKYTDLANCVI